MMLSRREALRIGGLLLAGPLVHAGDAAGAAEIAEVRMTGNKDGSLVWFEPVGLLIRPGDRIRWTNEDPGNAHTATAYHPDNTDHPLRIPSGAAAWDSDYLLPDQSFSVTLTAPGIYDYFCIPHEHAGMVGRIVVAERGAPPPSAPAGPSPLPGLERDPFPSIEDILAKGRVLRT
jgi:plastocyanin